MSRMLALAGVLVALALASGLAAAQQPTAAQQAAAPPPYGPPITLEQAKRVMAAAELEAGKNSWQVAIAILDSGGAGLRLLAVKDITPLEGGLPVILDGKIIGAIGVSGALSSQDAQVARAGAAAVK